MDDRVSDGLDVSIEMVEYIKKANPYREVPYFEGAYVKIGYGTIVSRLTLTQDRKMSLEEADDIFFKALTSICKKRYLAPIRGKEEYQFLFDVCVHFIYDLGEAVFKNCELPKYIERGDVASVIKVLDDAMEHYKDIPTTFNKRLHDASVLIKGSYEIGSKDGYKKRSFKKDVGFRSSY